MKLELQQPSKESSGIEDNYNYEAEGRCQEEKDFEELVVGPNFYQGPVRKQLDQSNYAREFSYRFE